MSFSQIVHVIQFILPSVGFRAGCLCCHLTNRPERKCTSSKFDITYLGGWSESRICFLTRCRCFAWEILLITTMYTWTVKHQPNVFWTRIGSVWRGDVETVFATTAEAASTLGWSFCFSSMSCCVFKNFFYTITCPLSTLAFAGLVYSCTVRQLFWKVESSVDWIQISFAPLSLITMVLDTKNSFLVPHDCI